MSRKYYFQTKCEPQKVALGHWGQNPNWIVCTLVCGFPRRLQCSYVLLYFIVWVLLQVLIPLICCLKTNMPSMMQLLCFLTLADDKECKLAERTNLFIILMIYSPWAYIDYLYLNMAMAMSSWLKQQRPAQNGLCNLRRLEGFSLRW